MVGVLIEPTATLDPDDSEQAFITAMEVHSGELLRHCTRMLRSPVDGEDALQETLLRAWRYRRTLASDQPRAWLYRIATNACCDMLSRRGSGCASLDESAPSPAPREQRPDVRVLDRDTFEHALLTVTAHLTPRQYAAFVLRDLLSCTAQETAAVLSISVPAANSAVQRARATLRTRLDPARWAAA
jgi:RNA polymerase sigma factor (sigma-70 family)